MDRKNIFSSHLGVDPVRDDDMNLPNFYWSNASFISNGVDLIEIKKAKKFYRDHQKSLKPFFSDKEVSYIRSSKKPHEALAVLLASKEAVFKALPQKKAGIAAFRNIEIKLGGRNRVFFPGLKLQVFKEKEYVVVHALGSDR